MDKRKALTLAMCLAASLAVADSDRSPSGQSRFDQFVGNARVPYPFARLRAKLEAQVEADPGGIPALKITLIPLGRSLQRMAAMPDFFASPRVVLAVDSASRPGVAPLQDRLFIGYQPKAAQLEVISYNEAAGRFEFQVVRDYMAGAVPVVEAASRKLCMSCHQNGAPIFSRPLWSETPANPAIAARLRIKHRAFQGVAISGTDIAYFIDASAHRANMFGVWQTIWRDGCGGGTPGVACRREWFDAALRYALTGALPDSGLPQLVARWSQQWPHGLPIPNASIPNRDPFSTAPIPRAADPLTPRAPAEIWTTPDPARLIVGLASLFNAADLDRRKRGKPPAAAVCERAHDALARASDAFDASRWLACVAPRAAGLPTPSPRSR
jgi:hypothetical protein